MLTNAIVLALREIRRNVLRSSLTTLGIIIGVASVIIMWLLNSQMFSGMGMGMMGGGMMGGGYGGGGYGGGYM